MPGAVAIVIVLVLVIPIAVLVGGVVGAGILGWLLQADVDEGYEGTEYLDLGH